MDGQEWDVYVVNDVRDWIDGLDEATHARVVAAIDTLAEAGPGLGRPLVDTITGLGDCQPEGATAWYGADLVRLRPVALQHPAGGRRQGRAWYLEGIPLAEQRYEVYLKERALEEGGRL